MRTNLSDSKRNSGTAVREPRRPPTAVERAERLKQREEEGRLAWEEYRHKQQAIDENTTRLKALRLARDAQLAARSKKHVS